MSLFLQSALLKISTYIYRQIYRIENKITNRLFS